MNAEPPTFEMEGLRIDVTYSQDTATLKWSGVSEIQDPENTIGPFLKGLLPSFTGKNVVLDFRHMEYWNSATLQPIMQLIKALGAEHISTELLYNNDVEWQRITFRCIKAIIRTFDNISFVSTAAK
jgi:hypothetical protein